MKHIKKLAMTIAGLWCCMALSAHDFEVDGIYYNKTSETEVEVTYEDDFNINYGDYTGKIEIPERVIYNDVTYTVTSIRPSAFSSCSCLTSITLPNSVTSIGASAFSGCI